jgi:hypothetical protein
MPIVPQNLDELLVEGLVRRGAGKGAICDSV